MLNASRYFHTLRYLRPVQIYGRLWYKLYHPIPDLSPPPTIRPLSGIWRDPARKSPSLIGPQRFRFLNVEHDILSAPDWNHPDWAKLWLYNLHYFDDLTAVNAADRIDWHRSLIMRWVAENPPGKGNGWEPYPLSLRIANWIKWALAGNEMPPAALESLAVQARYLTRRMEYHLLGNHLFANAKALVFAGLFFDGVEAGRWLNMGTGILFAELEEQILTDGGHFERSPMYHSIVLEDVIDLVNLLRVAGEGDGDLSIRLTAKVSPMLSWLKTMLHPDGEISFFNDTALRIAQAYRDLLAYAGRIGIVGGAEMNVTSSRLARQSGFARLEAGPFVVLADVGSIGPDYQPAHAHAETLSFELSIGGKRCLVNSGISCYEESAERLRQRSTAAHNCLAVDGADSSEIWRSHRVGKRARVQTVTLRAGDRDSTLSASHDGYLQLRGVGLCRREWDVRSDRLLIRDRVEGTGMHSIAIYLHINPDWRISKTVGIDFLLTYDNLSIQLTTPEQMEFTIETSTISPEFGISIPSQTVIGKCYTALPVLFETKISPLPQRNAATV